MVKTIIACLFPIFYLFLVVYSTKVVQGLSIINMDVNRVGPFWDEPVYQ